MFLPRHFFWRPRGVFRALADFDEGKLLELKSLGAGSGKPLHVAEVPRGKVIGNTLLAVTGSDKILGGVQGLTGCDEPEKHWLAKRRRFRVPRKVGGKALLISMNADNYFHWCFESLPRLKLLQQAGWNAERADWIVLPERDPGFQEEMLGIMGIPPAKFMRCSKWSVLEFDTLLVPSMPMISGGKIPDWMRDFLRTTFPPSSKQPADAKLYISRRGIRRRRMANEAELEERLSNEHQFLICAPETMTFREQVELFASAKIVVAPHGAGLTNLIFSRPGGHVIELFHPEHPNRCYERVAESAGFSYRSVIGRSTLDRPRPDDREAEFEINIDEVLAAVRAIESPASASTQ